MSNFKKICVTFSVLKLQKGDAYQNGEEFCHKSNGNDVKWPPPFFPSAATYLEQHFKNKSLPVADLKVDRMPPSDIS